MLAGAQGGDGRAEWMGPDDGEPQSEANSKGMGPDALWSIKVPTGGVLRQNSAPEINTWQESAVSRPPEQGY